MFYNGREVHHSTYYGADIYRRLDICEYRWYASLPFTWREDIPLSVRSTTLEGVRDGIRRYLGDK